MTATTFAGHFLGPGTHAARPSATGLPEGTMYVCTTDSKIERVVSGAWADYASLGSTETLPATIMDAKGDIIGASAADTPVRLAVGSNGQVLTADSAQTLGVKWAAAAGAAGMIADTLWDTKGDLAVASAADTGARLPVGTDGHVLTADSAQTLGIKWAAAAGGGGGGVFTSLSDTVLGAAGDFDVSSIAGTSKHMLVIATMRGNTANSTDAIDIRFNGDTGANYDQNRLRGTGSAASSSPAAGNTAISALGTAPGGSADADKFGTWVLLIPNYAATVAMKTVFVLLGRISTTTASGFDVSLSYGLWRSTAAITRIQMINQNASPGWVTGSRLTIYGLG